MRQSRITGNGAHSGLLALRQPLTTVAVHGTSVAQCAADASMERGGGVQISWTCDDRALEIAIADEGHGVASEANLFVPFYTTKPGGTGTGLVLSRQIAEAHGGTLTLENRSDRTGCIARLRLPLPKTG